MRSIGSSSGPAHVRVVDEPSDRREAALVDDEVRRGLAEHGLDRAAPVPAAGGHLEQLARVRQARGGKPDGRSDAAPALVRVGWHVAAALLVRALLLGGRSDRLLGCVDATGELVALCLRVVVGHVGRQERLGLLLQPGEMLGGLRRVQAGPGENRFRRGPIALLGEQEALGRVQFAAQGHRRIPTEGGQARLRILQGTVRRALVGLGRAAQSLLFALAFADGVHLSGHPVPDMLGEPDPQPRVVLSLCGAQQPTLARRVVARGGELLGPRGDVGQHLQLAPGGLEDVVEGGGFTVAAERGLPPGQRARLCQHEALEQLVDREDALGRLRAAQQGERLQLRLVAAADAELLAEPHTKLRLRGGHEVALGVHQPAEGGAGERRRAPRLLHQLGQSCERELPVRQEVDGRRRDLVLRRGVRTDPGEACCGDRLAELGAPGDRGAARKGGAERAQEVRGRRVGAGVLHLVGLPTRIAVHGPLGPLPGVVPCCTVELLRVRHDDRRHRV